MANKKITELNEATSISNNDWLVMVDVANDETKKIHAGEVGGNIPIQDNAPAGPEENDLWIDTSDDNRLKYFNGTSWEGVSDNVAGDTLPIGSQIPYGSTTPPANWLVCDGSAVSRTTYAELFAVIGTSYGAGDGSTTFNLPNKKGRKSVGYDSNDTDFNAIGKKGGEKAHTLTENEMPSHNHNRIRLIEGNQFLGRAGGSNSNVAGLTLNNGQYPYDNTTYNNADTSYTGGGQAHNIEDPYETDCWIIKAFQSSGLIANVSNTQSDSTTDTYSCDYINGIIESGSNANGEYIKYADGTMICTGVKYGNTTWEDWWGFCKRSPEGDNMLFASFPQAFVNGNARVSITTSHGNAVFSASYNSVQTDGFYFICYKPSSNTSTNYGIQYIAIGRWK